MTMMEEGYRQRGYILSNQMKSVLKKLLRKDKAKKKKTAPCPVLAATLKFHKDDNGEDNMDDSDPAADGVSAE